MRVQILAVLSKQVSVKNPNGSIGANVGAMYRLGLRSTELSNEMNLKTKTNVEFTTKTQMGYSTC